MKKISEEQWKYQLYKYEIDNKKKNDIRGIFEMFINVMNDILRKLINTNSKEEIDTCIEEINNLREYFNKTMKTVLKRYKLSKIIEINDTWRL
jgi:molecular chaperone GrpE (heat shock protein)